MSVVGGTTVIEMNTGCERRLESVLSGYGVNDFARDEEGIGGLHGGQRAGGELVLSWGGFRVIRVELDPCRLNSIGDLFQGTGDGWVSGDSGCFVPFILVGADNRLVDLRRMNSSSNPTKNSTLNLLLARLKALARAERGHKGSSMYLGNLGLR